MLLSYAILSMPVNLLITPRNGKNHKVPTPGCDINTMHVDIKTFCLRLIAKSKPMNAHLANL